MACGNSGCRSSRSEDEAFTQPTRLPKSFFKSSKDHATWHSALTPLDFNNAQPTVDRARRPGLLLSKNSDQSPSSARQRNGSVVKEPWTTGPEVEPLERARNSARQQVPIPPIVVSSPKEAVNATIWCSESGSSSQKAEPHMKKTPKRQMFAATQTSVLSSTSAHRDPGWWIKCCVIDTTADDKTIEYAGPFVNLTAANFKAQCIFDNQKRSLYRHQHEEHILCGQRRLDVPLRKLGWLGEVIVIVHVWRVRDEEQEGDRTKEEKVWEKKDGKAFL